jgi:hypothetical protein
MTSNDTDISAEAGGRSGRVSQEFLHPLNFPSLMIPPDPRVQLVRPEWRTQFEFHGLEEMEWVLW